MILWGIRTVDGTIESCAECRIVLDCTEDSVFGWTVRVDHQLPVESVWCWVALAPHLEHLLTLGRNYLSKIEEVKLVTCELTEDWIRK